MAQPHDRIARVNEILKREIADIIEKRGVGGGDTLVSVTKVHASESLRNATVYVSVFGSKPPEEILRALNIQHNVSRHVILKYTPVLHFVHDMNLEEGDKVLSLIRELEENEQ